nr:MAG TPA: hypothetical protein [Bacteriophage sp.]
MDRGSIPLSSTFQEARICRNIVNTCFLHLFNHINDVTKLTKNVHF